MMKTFLVCVVIIVVNFVSCTKDVQVISNQSDTEKIQNLVNFSLIASDELQQHIDTKSDDAIVLEMILDYNTVNDDVRFTNNNGKTIINDNLKKRALILSYNLR